MTKPNIDKTTKADISKLQVSTWTQTTTNTKYNTRNTLSETMELALALH